MKKRLAILNFALLFSIVSSIVFPALHSIEHIYSDYANELCLHKSPDGKAQITHEHSHLDHCYICGFSLGNFVAPSLICFEFVTPNPAKPYFFFQPNLPLPASGNAHPSRGPPSV